MQSKIKKQYDNWKISDYLKDPNIDIQTRIKIINDYFFLFDDKFNTEILVHIFDHQDLSECKLIMKSIIHNFNNLYYDSSELDDKRHFLYVTLASEAENEHLLRILTTIIKYNFGIISLRGIIKETNLFFKTCSTEQKNYILYHNTQDFFYDFE